tara:strand:- start:2510 stop:4249 length:1740 start_codon:yes stop_codon:yes gene_type:complete
MKSINENLDYLLEVETQQQRLDKLIRQGMLPARQLPILHRALASVKMGKILTPYEREALSKLLDKMMGFQFGDDITYNRARLHTQKTKYQTEENTMSEEEVKVYDGSEDEEEAKRDKKSKKKGSSKQARDAKKDDEAVTEAAASRPADEGQEEGDQESPKQGGSQKPKIDEPNIKQDSKPSIKEGLDDKRIKAEKKFSKLSRKIAKKQIEDEDVKESILRFNDLYKQNLETALANNKVDNVRDIPESIKQQLFKHVEEATYSDKQIRMAKGIAFDKRYKGGNMTGAYKKMEKIKKGLGDTKAASDALRRANEELEHPLEEGKLKDFALGHGYFEKDKEGAAKRKDPNWLSKQAASKKTISYIKKKTVKEAKKASHDHDGDGKIESGKEEYFGSRDKAIKKALKKVDKAAVKEEDTKELPKTPNQAVRDVHKTVADVLAGKTVEVSDEPLVTDPSIELNKGTGNYYDKDIQEGAKEDAMRDMKRDTKGMAPVKKDPKPGKSKHDGSENKGPDHIVSQLRKAISLGDKHDGVKFQDGKTHKIKAHHAHKFLNKYMSGKPADKEKMQSHGHASHDNFKKHLD